jgi:hypothetical protein
VGANFWTDPYHWFYDAGVPANLVASAICFVIAWGVGYFTAWKKHIRPHFQRIKEIHRHLDASNDWSIGDDA